MQKSDDFWESNFITSFISKDLLFFINCAPFHIEKGRYALLNYTACSTKPIETLIYFESSMKRATQNKELHPWKKNATYIHVSLKGNTGQVGKHYLFS